MSEYAKNIQTINDMWRKRIELQREGGGRMSEYIIDWDTGLVIDTFSKNNLREEIVRCRYCKFYHPREGATLNCRFEHPSMPNTVEWCIAEPDGFCAWGERMVGE